MKKDKKNFVTSKIKLLLGSNKMLENCIKEFPSNGSFYQAKAENLEELARLTENQSFYDEALISYTKAINCSPKNKLYLIERSELFFKLRKFDLAFLDLLSAKKIISKDEGINDYFNEVAENISNLNGIKKIAKKLVIDGKVPLGELKQYFPDMFIAITDNVIIRDEISNPKFIDKPKDNLIHFITYETLDLSDLSGVNSLFDIQETTDLGFGIKEFLKSSL